MSLRQCLDTGRRSSLQLDSSATAPALSMTKVNPCLGMETQDAPLGMGEYTLSIILGPGGSGPCVSLVIPDTVDSPKPRPAIRLRNCAGVEKGE